VWRQLEEIHATGKARAIGVSNFNTAQLRELLETAKVVPATNQIELHPYCHDVELEQFCKEKGIVLTSYGPLSPIVRFKGGPLDPVLERIAGRVGKTQAQVLLKWGLQKGFVLVTTTGKEERMKEFLDLEGWSLTEEEVEEIEKVGLTHHRRAYWKKDYPEGV
jgi:diketogulonate reductase-like aldo/keto reductase